MTCDLARDWILNAEKPADLSSATAAIAGHIEQCPSCRTLIDRVGVIEERWRALPNSPRSAVSKVVFLNRLENPAAPVALAAQPKAPRRWRRMLAWSTVAALFVAVGAGILFFGSSPQQIEAHPDVIEQLVDWNLDLTEAATPTERERIFADGHEKLRIRIKQAKLNDADRELADNLLATGSWLVKNDDPVEELQRFHRMADRLMEKMQVATDKSDAVLTERMARQYAKIAERGIDGNLERIKIAKVVDPERRQKIKQMLKEDQDRTMTLLILVEKSPAGSNKELRKALELSNKRNKVKKGN